MTLVGLNYNIFHQIVPCAVILLVACVILSLADDYDDEGSVRSYSIPPGDVEAFFKLPPSLGFLTPADIPDPDLILRPTVKIVGPLHNDPAALKFVFKLILALILEEESSEDMPFLWFIPVPNPNPWKLEDFKKNHSLLFENSRTNKNGVDLNRNFPLLEELDETSLENETLSIINLLNHHPISLSLSIEGGSKHGGIVFPYDHRKKGMGSNENLTPDDDVFNYLAESLYKNTPRACRGSNFKIHNGANLSNIEGSMMDYNYIAHGCLELTYFVDNWSQCPEEEDEFISVVKLYLQQSYMGIRGQILDDDSYNAIPSASLAIRGRNITFYSTLSGHYWRILLPGVYALEVNAEGYETLYKVFELKTGEQPLIENIFLKRKRTQIWYTIHGIDYFEDDISTTDESISINEASTTTELIDKHENEILEEKLFGRGVQLYCDKLLAAVIACLIINIHI